MITIQNEVNVSSKRLQEIFNISSNIAEDLKLTNLTVNICSSKEMISTYNADGLCWDETGIEIVNKRNKKDLFLVIAHELRHLYQFLNKKFLNDNYKMEVDACEYENEAYKKFYKKLK